MAPDHLQVLRALDLHQARPVADLVAATELPLVTVCDALAALVSDDRVRELALSPRAFLLKPAGQQLLRRHALSTSPQLAANRSFSTQKGAL